MTFPRAADGHVYASSVLATLLLHQRHTQVIRDTLDKVSKAQWVQVPSGQRCNLGIRDLVAVTVAMTMAMAVTMAGSPSSTGGEEATLWAGSGPCRQATRY